MLDMMKKLQEAQRQMKEIKDRLDTITVSGYSKNKEVVARANGNRKILGIEIEPDTNLENKVALENHVLEAVNNALKSERIRNEIGCRKHDASHGRII